MEQSFAVNQKKLWAFLSRPEYFVTLCLTPTCSALAIRLNEHPVSRASRRGQRTRSLE